MSLLFASFTENTLNFKKVCFFYKVDKIQKIYITQSCNSTPKFWESEDKSIRNTMKKLTLIIECSASKIKKHRIAGIMQYYLTLHDTTFSLFPVHSKRGPSSMWAFSVNFFQKPLLIKILYLRPRKPTILLKLAPIKVEST